MYEVYDYNPRTKNFYVTCETYNPDVAARWFRFQNLRYKHNWKYIVKVL